MQKRQVRHNIAHLPLFWLSEFEPLTILVRIHHLVQMVVRVASSELHARLTDIIHIERWIARRRQRNSRQLAQECAQERNSEDKVVLAQFVENLDHDRMAPRHQRILIGIVRIARILVEGVDPSTRNNDSGRPVCVELRVMV